MGEDAALQLRQLRGRVDAELLAQLRAGTPVRRQGIRLTTRAVQGQQQRSPEPLPEGMPVDQILERGHQHLMAPRPKPRLRLLLQRHEPQLVQAAAFGSREGHVLEPLQRVAVPERGCSLEQLPRLFP